MMNPLTRIRFYSVMVGLSLLALSYGLFFKEDSLRESIHKNLAQCFGYLSLTVSFAVGLFTSYSEYKR